MFQFTTSNRLLALSLSFLLIAGSEAFLIQSPRFSAPYLSSRHGLRDDSSTTILKNAVAGTQTAEERARRKELLSRNGPFFQFDRFQGGKVEFGSTAKLVTKLLEDDDDTPDPEGIADWLFDGRGLALSIWDEKLLSELGNSVYRLQTMKLQFVTIQLSPSVDMRMWTQTRKDDGSPLFLLQSVGFEPNIEILPGVVVSAASLGLTIEVSGQLRQSKDGRGVTGLISFATTGNLPPPMRLLPEPLLKLASDTINETIVQFAIQSFQKGAIQNYKEYQKARQKAPTTTTTTTTSQQ